MPVERIKVIAYSGYQGEETLRALFLNNERIEVTEILDRWVRRRVGDRKRKRFFILTASDGKRHKLYYDEETMEWRHAENRMANRA